MKKTLIAMFALAGMAMADSDLAWTVYTTSPTAEGTQSAQNTWGLVFDLSTGTGTRKAVSGSDGYADQTAFTLQNIKLSTGAGSVECNFVLMGDLTCNPDQAGDVGTVLGFIKSDAVSLAFNTATLDFSAQGITLTPNSSYRLFFTTEDYSGSIGTQVDLAGNTSFNVKSYTGAKGDDRTHLGFLGSGLGPGLAQGESPIAYINLTPAVPEPATATLSLLALAGLASRRRRH